MTMNITVERVPLEEPTVLKSCNGYLNYVAGDNTYFNPPPIREEPLQKSYTNELLSDSSKKVIFPYYDNLSHFWIESVVPVINYASQTLDRDWTAIFLIQEGRAGEKGLQVHDFAAKKLAEYLGIKVIPIEVPREFQFVQISNSDVIIKTKYEVGAIEILRDFIKSWGTIKNKELKKVYIPRPDRIDEEEQLISFLQNKNFEVVIPEKLTFEEQVSFFGSAEVLVSATGSQLFNLMFMPEASTVIELTIPLDYQSDDEPGRFHLMYSIMSAELSFTHISISNTKRGVDDTLSSLNNLKDLC